MSIVSHKHKFIFIKTRKTAGTSVSAAIASLCGEDDILALSQDVVDLTGIQRRNTTISLRQIGPYLLARHFYSVVRRATLVLRGEKRIADIEIIPTFKQHMTAGELKQLLGEKVWNTYYKFTIERNPYDRLVSFYKWRTHRFSLDCGFEDFSLSALEYDRKYRYAAYGFSNVPFYSLDGSSLCVDRVVKFENLDVGLCEALSEAGVHRAPDANLPKLKGGIRAGNEYRAYYTDRLIGLASEKFKLEKALFGYEF